MKTTASIILCAIGLLVGCASVPAEHFYALTAEAPVQRAVAGSVDDLSISVGPVTLAEIVDRPQLVVTVAANRVVILDQQRWAEPLASEISRVVALNLARQLGTRKVSTQPQIAGTVAGYGVALDVQRFESIAGKEVCIETLWTLRRTAGGEPISGRSMVKEPLASSGYDAIIAAHSRALAELSRDIARAISASMKSPIAH